MTTPHRGRLWTTEHTELTLAAAAVGIAGTAGRDLGARFTLKAGRDLLNVTAARAYVKGYIAELTIAVSPRDFQLSTGILRAIESLDFDDFPDLAAHDGDLMLHESRVLAERATTLSDRCEPSGLGGCNYQVETRSMRKLDRKGDTLWFCAQKDVATEFDIFVRVTITVLWLLP